MSIPVPERITRVEGCDCSGGLQWHTTDCSLWSLDSGQAQSAVADAEQRLRGYTAELNRTILPVDNSSPR